MASKPTLSRDYVYIPIADLNFDIADITLSDVAFTDAGVAPVDADWEPGEPVTVGNPLYHASIGDSIAILVGPARGDSVTTVDLAAQDWQTWVDIKVTGSDERVVRTAGLLEVNTLGT